MDTSLLIETLKRVLKGQGITYAQVAQRLGLSEASVKRMFSRRDFTLQRLEEVCRVAGLDFGELAREAAGEGARVTQLSDEQEREIVSDPKMLMVALCAVGNWTFEQIVDTYAITQEECVGYLARLDRHRIIELQPGNRIRPLISRTFAWLPDGPIQHYFRERVENEFLSSAFDRPDELFLFVSGMLSRDSMTELCARLRRVAREFAELHRDDLALPLASRYGTSLLLATRAWEPKFFRNVRREDRPPVPPAPARSAHTAAHARSPHGHDRHPEVARARTAGSAPRDFCGGALPAAAAVRRCVPRACARTPELQTMGFIDACRRCRARSRRSRCPAAMSCRSRRTERRIRRGDRGTGAVSGECRPPPRVAAPSCRAPCALRAAGAAVSVQRRRNADRHARGHRDQFHDRQGPLPARLQGETLVGEATRAPGDQRRASRTHTASAART